MNWSCYETTSVGTPGDDRYLKSSRIMHGRESRINYLKVTLISCSNFPHLSEENMCKAFLNISTRSSLFSEKKLTTSYTTSITVTFEAIMCRLQNSFRIFLLRIPKYFCLLLERTPVFLLGGKAGGKTLPHLLAISEAEIKKR